MKCFFRFFLATLLVVMAVPVLAQQTADSNTLDEFAPVNPDAQNPDKLLGPIDMTKLAIGPTFGGIYPPPSFDPRVNWRQEWICRDFHPANVTGFQVVCGPGTTFLDVHITDCCIPGDHWQLKSKTWDANPNTAVTTSPGPVPVWSVPGRTYNYGGTPWSTGLRAYVECSMLHGVDVFPADSVLWLSSDGACTVTPDAPRNRIDRSP